MKKVAWSVIIGSGVGAMVAIAIGFLWMRGSLPFTSTEMPCRMLCSNREHESREPEHGKICACMDKKPSGKQASQEAPFKKLSHESSNHRKP